MLDSFTPSGMSWQRADPALATVRRITTALWLVPGVLVLAGVSLVWPKVWWLSALIVVLGAATLAWAWVLCGRTTARIGYIEGPAELYVTSGAIFRTHVVVPYGRMQYVDVTSGPLLRSRGLATLTLNTASPSTTARIPGLPEAVAAALRDRLTEASDSTTSGL